MEEPEKFSNEETYHFAGFGWRCFAYFLDAIIIALFSATFINPLLIFLGIKLPEISVWKMLEMQKQNPLATPFELMGISLHDFIIIQLASVIVFWLYYALMESSKKQATVGKLMLGMVVTDIEGAPVSFAKASARTFGKYLSALSFFVGFIMTAFTEKRQALHDKMANCLVLKKD